MPLGLDTRSLIAGLLLGYFLLPIVVRKVTK